MDSFGDRNVLANNIEELLIFHKSIISSNNSQSTSLFDGLDSKPMSILLLKEAPPATLTQKLDWEKELLGLYISGHPLDMFDEQLKKSAVSIRSILNKNIEQGPKKFGREQTKKELLVVHIDTVKIIMTKSSNKKMAFLTVQDKTGSIEAVVFPETFAKLGASLKEGTVVAIECSPTERDGKKSLLIENLKVL